MRATRTFCSTLLVSIPVVLLWLSSCHDLDYLKAGVGTPSTDSGSTGGHSGGDGVHDAQTGDLSVLPPHDDANVVDVRGGSNVVDTEAGVDAESHHADANLDATGDGRIAEGGKDATPDADATIDGGGCANDTECPNGKCLLNACRPVAGFALQFDGIDDSAWIPRVIADDFTIEFWIRSTTSGTAGAWWSGAPVIWSDVAGITADFNGVIHNGVFTFAVGLIATEAGMSETILTTSSQVSTGQWTHVAIARNRATGLVTLLVNGVSERSANGSTDSLSAATQILILNTGVGLFAQASIDELRLWSVVRSESDIAANMRKRLTGTEPGLVSYYRFDEGTGTIVVDSSGLGHTMYLGASGVASSMPSWVVSGVSLTE